ncbi:MAG: hypothetical protein EBR82_85375, partial [Caulobacteraceae bacterium]|nr:hypothetical protein [Caulobacteraceae bacterium]
ANNTAVGYQALDSTTTGKDNTALGIYAGQSQTTATSNCFVGTAAGSATTGSFNTFIGSGEIGVSAGAGEFVTTGSKNTIIGRYSGNQGGLDIRTASNFIVLSDGDGNPRQWINNNGAAVFPTQGDAGYGTINLVNDDPFIRFFDNGGTSTADKKKWDVRAVGASGSETFDIRTVNDANTVFTTLFSIRHTNGAVGLSTSPATTGTGITFPATQSASSNANTLDDYEEGTFTPYINAAGISGVTYSVRAGRYTKIGNRVSVDVAIELSNKGTGGSGNLNIEGLPFTASNTSGYYINYGCLVDSLNSDCRQVAAQTIPNQSYVIITKNGGSTAQHSALQYSDITNITIIRFYACYEVA